mgnify:CR=1 FL=1
MDIPYWILVSSTLIEVLLLLLAAVFFVKLKKSESLMRALQDRQQEFLRKLDFNAQLEKEIVSSFASRQEELAALEEKLQSAKDRKSVV